jgi:hypothetical protein
MLKSSISGKEGALNSLSDQRGFCNPSCFSVLCGLFLYPPLLNLLSFYTLMQFISLILEYCIQPMNTTVLVINF